jgi:RNA polymerase sigma factor (sigma-70 family)
MRRILVNYAVQRGAGKRTLPSPAELNRQAPGACDFGQILAVDEALKRLRELDVQQSRVVELRYFGGLTEEEIAGVLGVSPRTVRREWTTAKLWLTAELSARGEHDT